MTHQELWQRYKLTSFRAFHQKAYPIQRSANEPRQGFLARMIALVSAVLKGE